MVHTSLLSFQYFEIYYNQKYPFRYPFLFRWDSTQSKLYLHSCKNPKFQKLLELWPLINSSQATILCFLNIYLILDPYFEFVPYPAFSKTIALWITSLLTVLVVIQALSYQSIIIGGHEEDLAYGINQAAGFSRLLRTGTCIRKYGRIKVKLV